MPSYLPLQERFSDRRSTTARKQLSEEQLSTSFRLSSKAFQTSGMSSGQRCLSRDSVNLMSSDSSRRERLGGEVFSCLRPALGPHECPSDGTQCVNERLASVDTAPTPWRIHLLKGPDMSEKLQLSARQNVVC